MNMKITENNKYKVIVENGVKKTILNEEIQGDAWYTPDEMADLLYLHLEKISEEMNQQKKIK